MKQDDQAVSAVPVTIPSAALREWGYAMAEGAGWLRAVGELENDPDAVSISDKLTQQYAEVAYFLDALGGQP